MAITRYFIVTNSSTRTFIIEKCVLESETFSNSQKYALYLENQNNIKPLFGLKTFKTLFYLVLPLFGVVPIETFLVKFDNNLGDFHICLLGCDQVGLVTSFPLDKEEQLSRVIGRPLNKI